MVTITDAQRAALARLAPVVRDTHYLVGGVAVAAYFHHRASHDLDLFTNGDPTALEAEIERMPGVVIDAEAERTLHFRIDGIPTSLLGYRYPLLEPALPVDGLPIAVASIVDLASMKLSAIASRGAARDFWDLHTIITRTPRTFGDYLSAYRLKFPVEDIGHVIRSAGYFGDSEAAPLPKGLTAEAWDRIRADFESWVRGAMSSGTSGTSS